MTSVGDFSVSALLLVGYLTAACNPIMPDDGAVLAAVIEQRLLPQALTQRRDQAPESLLVASPTAHPFCEPTEQRREQCLDPQQLTLPELLGQHSISGRGVLGFSSDSTARLATALTVRNVGGPRVPVRESDRVRIDKHVSPGGQEGPASDLGTIMLSLPAYDTGGDAVVLASYHCGPLCGYTSLFRVSRRWSRWEVVAQAWVSVS